MLGYLLNLRTIKEELQKKELSYLNAGKDVLLSLVPVLEDFKRAITRGVQILTMRELILFTTSSMRL